MRKYLVSLRMNPILNGSSAIQHFKHGDGIEMHNGIILDLYVALPRMNVQCNLRKNLHNPVNSQHMILIMCSNLEIV